MNERITDLHNQAIIFSHNNGGLRISSHIPNDYMKKLAELIVKEMLQTCEDHPAWTGRMIGEQIKQHFGVEE